jgi:hypothetical protein
MLRTYKSGANVDFAFYFYTASHKIDQMTDYDRKMKNKKGRDGEKRKYVRFKNGQKENQLQT